MSTSLPTRVAELLGTEYPVVQRGMQWVARAEQAAAVTEKARSIVIGRLSEAVRIVAAQTSETTA